MRYYIKVADAVAGVGFVDKSFWTKRAAARHACKENIVDEYAPAIWILTRKEKKEYLRS